MVNRLVEVSIVCQLVDFLQVRIDIDLRHAVSSRNVLFVIVPEVIPQNFLNGWVAQP